MTFIKLGEKYINTNHILWVNAATTLIESGKPPADGVAVDTTSECFHFPADSPEAVALLQWLGGARFPGHNLRDGDDTWAGDVLVLT